MTYAECPGLELIACLTLRLKDITLRPQRENFGDNLDRMLPLPSLGLFVQTHSCLGREGFVLPKILKLNELLGLLEPKHNAFSWQEACFNPMVGIPAYAPQRC